MCRRQPAGAGSVRADLAPGRGVSVFDTPFDDDEEVPDEAMLLAACFILADSDADSDEEWVKETVEAVFDAS